MDALSGATAADKAEIYAQLGLHLTYNPQPADSDHAGRNRCRHVRKGSCPRGDLNPHALLGH